MGSPLYTDLKSRGKVMLVSKHRFISLFSLLFAHRSIEENKLRHQHFEVTQEFDEEDIQNKPLYII